MTDRQRVSREMLAYILDSGSAPVCTLVPLSSWAVYIAGLLVGYGPVLGAEQGMELFIRSIPFNFYAWFAVILAGLIAFRLVPNYGPMRRSEHRAQVQGKVLRDGATPLTGVEMDQIRPLEGKRGGLFLYLVVPVLIVLGVALGTFLVIEETKILEAFLAALIYQALTMAIGGHFNDVNDAFDVALRGIKGVLPALLILALAYSINSITNTLGAQDFVISITEGWMSTQMLPLITFLTGAFISFFTGTSWGTYAILTPFVLPVAFNLSGGNLSTGVMLTVGALVGGALFGDHSSPVSDTTCLSSFGAGSDHMDHVTTQLPYALTAAALACCFYLVLAVILI
jgi:Na+/H+ antiporter NhaC